MSEEEGADLDAADWSSWYLYGDCSYSVVADGVRRVRVECEGYLYTTSPDTAAAIPDPGADSGR